ncbi:MAG: enoyl-CoA hydratase/isomerase family protein [Planctomycetota bacterium]|jgi:enoyl-CoA hydratase
MEYETILFEKRDRVAQLTLNRPKRANTITDRLGAEINHALDEIAADKEIHAIILTGAGKHFCAGADLREPTSGGRVSVVSFISHLEDVRVPVICAINGSAMGGGCEIALACDIRIAAEGIQLGLPEISFGALPAGGGTQRLPRLVGSAKAKELILTGLPIEADEALRIGLVNHVVPAEELMPRCEEMAAVFAQRARFALSAAKYLINEGIKLNLEAGLKLEHQVIGKMASKRELAEAVKQAMETQATYADIFSKSKR